MQWFIIKLNLKFRYVRYVIDYLGEYPLINVI